MIMPETGVGDTTASVPCPRLASRAEWHVDATVHVVGLVLGLTACTTLALMALPGGRSAVAVSLAVYGAGLLAMLGCSALYNLAGDGPRKALWRRLDHAAIFMMIAGTYTPFLAIAIGGAWGIGLLVFVWTVATTGAVLNYSMGVLFYCWHRLPYQRAIWHGFVLTAAACHYFASWISWPPARA